MNLETAIRLALANNERAVKADQNVAGRRRPADQGQGRLPAAAQRQRQLHPPAVRGGPPDRQPEHHRPELQRAVGGGQLEHDALRLDRACRPCWGPTPTVETERLQHGRRQAQAGLRGRQRLPGDARAVDQVLEASKRRSTTPSRASTRPGPASRPASSRSTTSPGPSSSTPRPRWGSTQVQGQVETSYLELGYLLNAPDADASSCVPDFLIKAVDESIAAGRPADRRSPDPPARRPGPPLRGPAASTP